VYFSAWWPGLRHRAVRQWTNTSLVSLFYAAQKTSIGPVKNWESIGDNLKKADWSSACISSTDHNGRQFWVVAAAREDAGRFYFARGWSAYCFYRTGSNDFDSLLGSDIRINFLGDLFLKNQGPSPIGSRAARNYSLRQTVNLRIAIFRPHAARPAARPADLLRSGS